MSENKSNNEIENKDTFDAETKYIIPINDYYKKNPEKHERDEKLGAFINKIFNPLKYFYERSEEIRKKDTTNIKVREKIILTIDNFRKNSPNKLFAIIMTIFVMTILGLGVNFNDFNKKIVITEDTKITLNQNDKLYILNEKLEIYNIPEIILDNPYRNEESDIVYTAYDMLHIYSLFYRIYLYNNPQDFMINEGEYILKGYSNIEQIIQQIKTQSLKL